LVTAAAPAPLPWRGAAPAPRLQEWFAKMVMPPVALLLPGMGRVRYTRDLSYSSNPNPNLRMDVYKPHRVPRGELLGAVIFIHGGADASTKPKDWGNYQSWGRLVAASGLVAVTFSHRLNFPDTQVLEGAEDVAAVIATVKANAARFGIDPSKLCVIAFSAGGPLLAPYLVDAPPGIKCAAGYYPFMDIRQSPAHRDHESAETLQRFSNILAISKPGRKTPLLVVRGGKDEIPSLLNSIDRFAAAALEANYPLALLNHPEGPHGFENQLGDDRTRQIIAQTLAFFHDHIGTPATRRAGSSE
jgi:acetyl esterase/lipase